MLLSVHDLDAVIGMHVQDPDIRDRMIQVNRDLSQYIRGNGMSMNVYDVLHLKDYFTSGAVNWTTVTPTSAVDDFFSRIEELVTEQVTPTETQIQDVSLARLDDDDDNTAVPPHMSSPSPSPSPSVSAASPSASSVIVSSFIPSRTQNSKVTGWTTTGTGDDKKDDEITSKREDSSDGQGYSDDHFGGASGNGYDGGLHTQEDEDEEVWHQQQLRQTSLLDRRILRCECRSLISLATAVFAFLLSAWTVSTVVHHSFLNKKN